MKEWTKGEKMEGEQRRGGKMKKRGRLYWTKNSREEMEERISQVRADETERNLRKETNLIGLKY